MNGAESAGRRITADYGRYLEEFQVGDVFEHRPGRTITEADDINFSLMTRTGPRAAGASR